MITPYTITKSNGTTLSLIYPFESIGPTPGGTGASSTPLQVGAGFDAPILSSTVGQIILAGNVAAIFGVGFKFVITGSSAAGNNTPTVFTVATSVYNVGLTQTFVTAAGLLAAATPGTATAQVFTMAGDQTGGRGYYQTPGNQFQIENPNNVLAVDNGTYAVFLAAVYDTVSGYTAVPVNGRVTPAATFIPASSPFVLAQYQITYTLGAFSVLDMVGQDSLNWGAKIWENMLRMTEHFAFTSSPDTNTVNIGANTPLIGQLWFDTTTLPTGEYKYWNGTSWNPLGSAVGPVPGVVASVSAGPGISVTGTATNPIVNNTGVISVTAGTNISITGTAQNPIINATAGGTVTSVATTGSTGLVVGGSPITTSGTLTFTLDADLQALSALSGTGFVQRTGVNTYTVTNLTSGQVTTALGFTPYNSTNPSGYISSNQNITLSGAVTGSGTTSIVTTLANSGVVAGPYGSSTATSVINVNAKGLITAAATTAITGLAPAGGTVGEVLTKNSSTSYDYSWIAPGSTTPSFSANQANFPSGFQIRFGQVASAGGTQTFSFSPAFATACYIVIAVVANSTGVEFESVQGFTASGFTYYSNNSCNVNYIAFGH